MITNGEIVSATLFNLVQVCGSLMVLVKTHIFKKFLRKRGKSEKCKNDEILGTVVRFVKNSGTKTEEAVTDRGVESGFYRV